jgi:peptide/nickel transport system permease protein
MLETSAAQGQAAARGDGIIGSLPDDQVFIASQWQLIWWRFVRHRVAVASGIIILCLYILAIFADFFAPYLPNTRNQRFAYMPPQRIHFVDAGVVGLRPFVYGVTREMDLTTGRRVYSDDKSQKYPIQFLVQGEPYRLLGLFDTDIHLFGPAPGGVLYLLGTDIAGRDMLSQIIHGARISLSIGLLGVALSVTLGILIGGLSGYFGGTLDLVIQRLIEVIHAFPGLALFMALSAALPPYWTQLQVYLGVVVILSLIGWTSLARAVRGKMISLREEDFILAARLNGAGTLRIIRIHMVPSFMSHIIATLTLAIPGIILGETALSFLGIGLARPVVSWGVLLQQSQKVEAIMAAPWFFIPGVVLAVTVLAFNFLGDGLRDASDPYSRTG